MRACWLKWVGRDWSISADYIWLNYSGANNRDVPQKLSCRIGVDLRCLGALAHWDSEACATKSSRGFIPTRYEIVC